MRLLLIRHPEPDVPNGLCYGRMDVPALDHAHDRLLEALRSLWRTLPAPAKVYTSPLQRCARVAQELAGSIWPQPTREPRLAELDFGQWEGRLWQDLPHEEIGPWRANLVEVPPPGGESLGQLAQRVGSFAREQLDALATSEDDIVVLMTHAGVIQTLPRVLLGDPLSEFGRTRVDYGSVTALRRREGRYRRSEDSDLPVNGQRM